MANGKVKISIVEYLNSKPFLQGLNKFLTKKVDVSLDIPSVCAQKVISKEVVLGLVPVAVIPKIQNYSIVGDFCIGSTGKVRSVKLFSNVPKDKIKSILLDFNSRTSVQLIKIIASKFWNLNYDWLPAEKGFEAQIIGTTAAVIIGDKALELENSYLYSYDLAYEWVTYTQLPFVFACWVSNAKLEDDFLRNFNSALQWGVDNRLNVLDEKMAKYESLMKYLTEALSYEYNVEKQKGMNLFLKYQQEIS